MKYALLVIDMQNGFLNPESPLCIRGARATVPACARLIAGCRKAGIPVVFVNRAYRADGSDVENTRYAVWAQGGKPLTAAPVKAVDLRAGAALVIAGLAAKGTTEVEDIHHIERGYECIVDKLRHLGADIELVQQAEPGLRTAL